MFAQWRLSSVWASAQSDQSFPEHFIGIGTQTFFRRTAKLIRLGKCPGWSLHRAHRSILFVFSCSDSHLDAFQIPHQQNSRICSSRSFNNVVRSSTLWTLSQIWRARRWSERASMSLWITSQQRGVFCPSQCIQRWCEWWVQTRLYSPTHIKQAPMGYQNSACFK